LQNVNWQNVDWQNVDLQNVDLQNVDFWYTGKCIAYRYIVEMTFC
jgi:hypothetical protein